MRFIHTADWHFGQTLKGHDRKAEHEFFVGQLIDYIINYEPDALLIAGDLYDSNTPSNETDNFFRQQILRIKQACPQLHIIMIAGNHDGYSKHEADSQLWQLGGIDVVGQIAFNNQQTDYNRHIIYIKDKGYILAVPFTHYFPPMPENDNITERRAYFFSQLLKRADELNTQNLPIVMMAHINYQGANIANQESLVVGGEDATPAEELGSGFDYLAMGHIHFPQTHDKARYSGSPIPINFTETYQHSVTLVDIKEHNQQPDITTLPLNNLFEVCTLRQGQATIKDFLQEVEQECNAKRCYYKLIINASDATSATEQDILNTVKHIEQSRYCGYEIAAETELKDTNIQHNNYTPQQLEQYDPLKLAKEYYKEQFNDDMDEETEQLLTEIILNTK